MEITRTQKRFYGWNMVVVLWLQYFLNMGLTLYGGSVIGSAMLSSGAVSSGVYGISFTILKLVYGGISAVVAAFIGKFGIRKSLVFGCAMTMCSALFLGLAAKEPWHFPLFFGVTLGLGIGFSTLVPVSTGISRWFSRMRGKAMAAALTASSVAGLIFAPLISVLIQYLGLGWRQMWLMVAGLMFVPVAVAILFVKEYPADIGQEPDGGIVGGEKPNPGKKENRGNDSLRTTYEWLPGEAFRTASFWLVVVLSCISQYAWFFFTSQWLPIMRNFNLDPTLAALTVSTFTIASLPARIASGFLIDRIKPKFVFMIGFSCTILAYIIALTITESAMALAFVAAVFAAFGFGTCYIAFTTTTAQFFGVKAYSKLNGNVLMIESVVSCLAPMTTGFLFGAFGNYSISFVLIIVLSAAGFVISVFLNMPKPPSAG